MLKIMLYAYHEHNYSSRGIEKACRRDINYMYLLEGRTSPDHATIARFRSIHFAQVADKYLAMTVNYLMELGEISGREISIDGTKIEANANKYTFIWKKAVTKNQAKGCIRSRRKKALNSYTAADAARHSFRST